MWIGSKYIKRVSDAIDVAEAADHTLVTTLRGMSLSDASIVRLMQSDRAGLLKRVLDSPARRTSTDVASRDPGFIGGANAFEIGKNGERVASYLRGAISSFGDTLPPQLARYVSIGGSSSLGTTTSWRKAEASLPNSGNPKSATPTESAPSSRPQRTPPSWLTQRMPVFRSDGSSSQATELEESAHPPDYSNILRTTTSSSRFDSHSDRSRMVADKSR